jgi:predicted secreted protein
MDILTGIFIFILIWWVVIFTVLPFGNAAPAVVEQGHSSGAPARPRLKQKLLWTTVISLAITAIIVLAVHYTGFSLAKWVKTWNTAEY